MSAVFEASWHRGKRAVYDGLLRQATRLGLDLRRLVDDTSPPPPADTLPIFVHDPVDVPAIALIRYSENAIDHELALSTRTLAELERMSTMFDVPAYDLLDEAYLVARPRLY